ncbi:putative serine/threonine protein phosphatase [Cardiosporidium cionae]|uniref:Serine/threonine-protein phosphatase n=1 Tax=Cardiosporidium cionae TaxID=476202 RepID=A0ABQ7J3Q3_9APIC|nr:putative serine/threonine protein phosphatase [Cardiosporidium cionae]|eukprot:KAF8817726.1 putative serine/threonine protein phosphatase [Cardiosporidium cionae]
MSQPEKWLQQFRNNPVEILSEQDLKIVCHRVIEILVAENNVHPVSAPVTICGDIHGQFYDLLELFAVGGQIPEQKYIFLGDYVDRGFHSIETFEYLLVLKLNFPDSIVLLRGNHESRQITTVYGFYDECFKKYGNANAWKYCTELFDYLTLAAVIDQRIFCVHGGLSPEVRVLDQLRLLNRVQEIPHTGPFGDIVWSDPDYIQGWAANSRGAGWIFGARVATHFSEINDLDLIVRAHQLVMEGYKYMFENSCLVTMWSAPNYCYRCGNVAAIMHMDDKLSRTFTLFRDTEESRRSLHTQSNMPYFL